MQVFDMKSGEPYLIGRVDSANFSQKADDTSVSLSNTALPPKLNIELHVQNWMPLYPAVSTSAGMQLVVKEGSAELKQIKSILAMLVERNGGAVHVDIGDILADRPLTIMQHTDPWGIVLTTEAL